MIWRDSPSVSEWGNGSSTGCLRHTLGLPRVRWRARRTELARRLLDDTDLPVSQIALAAGFASLRQFNHAIRQRFGEAPTVLRARRHGADAPKPGEAIHLRLPYRPPLDGPTLLGYFAARAIPGVEDVTDDAYRRTVRIGDSAGVLELRPGSEAFVSLRVQLPSLDGLPALVARARRIFDLDADPLPIAAQLRRSPILSARVARSPGLRVPGAWDAFEVAVRAVLGQQVTVRGASTLAGRLVKSFGEPIATAYPATLTHLFPRAERLAESDLASIGLPRARAEALRGLATAVATGALVLDAARGLDDFVARLVSLPGIGDWTAHYVALRACGEPDAFPADDLWLRRALGGAGAPVSAKALLRAAEAWRPWRAYGALYLWMGGPDEPARVR